MRFETAKQISDMLLRHLQEQGALLQHLRQSEPETFCEVRKILGATMGAICLDALNPILDEHPSLKPPDVR